MPGQNIVPRPIARRPRRKFATARKMTALPAPLAPPQATMGPRRRFSGIARKTGTHGWPEETEESSSSSYSSSEWSSSPSPRKEEVVDAASVVAVVDVSPLLKKEEKEEMEEMEEIKKEEIEEEEEEEEEEEIKEEEPSSAELSDSVQELLIPRAVDTIRVPVRRRGQPRRMLRLEETEFPLLRGAQTVDELADLAYEHYEGNGLSGAPLRRLHKLFNAAADIIKGLEEWERS